jgi:hypothetical protein
VLITSEFKWKCTPIIPLDLNKTAKEDQTPHLIGEYTFEIHITGEVPEHDRKNFGGDTGNTEINQHLLKDEAFQPRTLNVRIEDGEFDVPRGGYGGKDWNKRLIFDTSPFGLESDWKDEFHHYLFWLSGDRSEFYDHKEFVAYSPHLDALPDHNLDPDTLAKLDKIAAQWSK